MNKSIFCSFSGDKSNTPAAKNGRRKIRNDILFIASLFCIVLIIGASIFLSRGEGDTVKVTVDGTLYGIYPLHEEAVVEIRTGTDGRQVNVLIIKNGKAFVEAASCPDGICAAHHPISRDGESIVCLPHQVVITVYAQDNALDMIA